MFELKKPTSREFVGGDLLAQCLWKLGVKVAFGLHGGHLDAFLIGAEEIGIRLIDVRHEATAVRAAEGYSKVTSTLGVCFVTANSGFANGIAGLATAFADRSPILCITSSAPMRDVDTNVLQGFHDQVTASKPFTKFAQRIPNGEEIPRLTAYAVRQATCGAPGPVLLDLPIEVLFSSIKADRISWGSISSPLSFPSAPDAKAIDEIAELIRNSKRPTIIAGTGARRLEDDEEFQHLLTNAQLPVFNSGKISSPLPFEHSMRAGNATLFGLLPLDSKPDLVILAGCRTGMYLGMRKKPTIPSSETCKLVQIDIDGGEIGRDLHVDVGVVSDTRLAFGALSRMFKDHPVEGRGAWVSLATSLKNKVHPQDREPVESTSGRLHPYHATKLAFEALESNSMLCIDGGDISVWSTQLSESARPSLQMQTTGYLGMLGNGWGYALGAAVADPTRLIVNVQGDGSAGFHLSELDTYARHKCRVLTLLFNNHAWGMSLSGQNLIYSNLPNRPISLLSESVDFAVTAGGLGCPAARVLRAEKISAAVKKAQLAQGPSLVEILIDTQPIHPGVMAMVGHVDDSSKIVVPYYDNIDKD